MPDADRTKSPPGWGLRAYFAALVLLFMVAAIAGGILIRVQARDDARRAAEEDASFAATKAGTPIARASESPSSH